MELGVSLLATILEVINKIHIDRNVYGWNVSTIALSRVRSTPIRFNAFVANKIAIIQEEVENAIIRGRELETPCRSDT